MARSEPAPIALNALLVLNGLVFVAWWTIGDAWPMERHFLVSGSLVARGHVWTLLTSALSHIDFGHLLFNMLALWLFGRIVERVIGSWSFVALYVVGGVTASLGHVAWGLVTGDPTPALGASGSVMAVAVCFAVLFPFQRLYLFFMVPMPAWFAVVLYVGLDLLGLFDGRSSIAHAAHLGGALTGLVYGLVWGRARLRRLLRQR